MQFPATKKALSWCAAWIVMGAVAQSSRMAAGGVFALIVWTPVALVIDWRRSKTTGAAREYQLFQHDDGGPQPAPHLSLPPPEAEVFRLENLR